MSKIIPTRGRLVAGIIAIGSGLGVLGEMLGVLDLLAWLPRELREKIMSDHNLAILALILLTLGLILLGSIAWHANANQKLARISNDKAWAFSAKFKALDEKYDEMLGLLRDIKALQTETKKLAKTASENADGMLNRHEAHKKSIDTLVEEKVEKVARQLAQKFNEESMGHQGDLNAARSKLADATAMIESLMIKNSGKAG